MAASFVIICYQHKNTDCFLLLQRGYTAPYEPGKWSLPGGKSNKGETSKQTAIREVKEETGLDISQDLQQVNIQHVKANYFFVRLNQLPPIVLCWENIGYGWFTYQQIKQMQTLGHLTASPIIPTKIEALQSYILVNFFNRS